MAVNNLGTNFGATNNVQPGSGFTVEDLLKDPKLLEQYNGQTIRINGVDYAVEDGEVKPANESGDNSIFGNDESGEIGDTVDFSGAKGAEGAEISGKAGHSPAFLISQKQYPQYILFPHQAICEDLPSCYCSAFHCMWGLHN